MNHKSCCHCIYQSNAMPCSTSQTDALRTCSETTTAATTLPACRVGRCGGNVLDTSDTHTSTGKSAKSGLSTGAGGLGTVTTSGADLDVQSGDTELLAASGCNSR